MLPMLLAVCGLAAGPGEFVDHGIAAPVAECRSVSACYGADGQPLLVATTLDLSPTGYLLVTDLVSGETRQFPYPEGAGNGAVFTALVTSAGRFYTFAGRLLLEFDPAAGQWLFTGVPDPRAQHVLGVGMAEGPDGRVYAATYPNCNLVSYDPATGEMANHGQMDPAEKYPNYLAFDDTGWLYLGIGTARQNLVAYHLASGERRQLVDEAARPQGSATAFRGVDGAVYGQVGSQRYRLLNGEATAIEAADAAARAVVGVTGYGTGRSITWPDGHAVTRVDLEERVIAMRSPAGETRDLSVEYVSGGAEVTSLAAGPDGRVYASTAHPMHLVQVDPATDGVTDFGAVRAIGGGNFCSMIAQGELLAAGEYAGGRLWLFDPTQPFDGSSGTTTPNPRSLAAFREDITRPRTIIAHPDGRHVIMAGYMGYGLRGGGMAIADLVTGETAMLKHTELVADQSTYTLTALPNGDLVGGTSIHTPGGGHPTATEAVVYRFDWQQRQVVNQVVPVPGAPHIEALVTTAEGKVIGLTSQSRLFVYDPASGQVGEPLDWSAYGGPVRHALHRDEAGMVWAVMRQAIVRLDPVTLLHAAVAKPPGGASAGGALYGGRLWFAARGAIWSWYLP